tara:strand:+ start:86 stop:823 length:738 start_codon:yes stop_codon:yes gene_type:complete
MSFILKKRFGQNFLIDRNVLNKIQQLIPSENLNILEIGPGDGRLTDKIILKKPKKLTLVEIDDFLVKDLKIKYSKNKNMEIINSDILNFRVSNHYQLVISNLPYNISSQILVKLTLLNNSPELLILMFQKEFAKRLLNKKLNSINSLVNCFYKINLNFNISKNCFRPIPKVDSSILTFKKLSKRLLNQNEINDFIIFKRKLFSQKRKSLRNVLKKYNLDENYNLDLRVENLELRELVKIFRAINL